MDMKYMWFMPPVTLHSSRDFDCGSKTPEQCEWYQHRWHFWYIADWVYALPTVAFFMSVIGLFIIAYVFNQLVALRRSEPGPAMWRRAVAVTRYLSYRGFRIEALQWNSASIGLLLLAVAGTIFFACMTLIPQPYYWPGTDTTWGNSPPLGTRSGWMALACMPFVFATASKANWITLLTGVSHEQLQTFHRWTAYAFFIMALLHTFPFIVWHFRNGDMVQQFNIDNYFTYWTGVVALLSQAWLTFGSFSWFRNLNYELFKIAHFGAVILFVLIFFWHCGGTLSSWDYFIAAAAVYIPCLAFPWIRTLFEYGANQTAQVVVEKNEFVRITVPAKFEWVPGQHCFLRFRRFGIHGFSSHPFTICSLPHSAGVQHPTAPTDKPSSPPEQSNLVFYLRVRKGFTRAICQYAEARPGRPLPLLVDGPYGGIDNNEFYNSHRLLVIAGGSGAGWSLPLIEQFIRFRLTHAAKTMLQNESGVPTDEEKANTEIGTVEFTHRAGPASLLMILATRDVPTRTWFHESIADLLHKHALTSADIELSVEVYLTGEADRTAHKSDPKAAHVVASVDEKSSDASAAEHAHEKSGSEGDAVAVIQSVDSEYCGRPCLSTIVHHESSQVAHGGKALAVFVCGPESMQHDCRNAVAAENLQLLNVSEPGSVYLHIEHFSWA